MDFYIGTILPWAGTYAPSGWLLCQGQTMQVNQYNALFAVIGCQYGGNGSSTFCLPNLQGRIPVGEGAVPGTSSNFVQGAVGGSISVNLPNTPPAHTHTATVSAPNVSASFSMRASTNIGATVAPPSDSNAANYGIAKVDAPDLGGNVNLYKDISNDGTAVVKLKSYPCDVTSSGGTVTVAPTGSTTPATVQVLQPYQVIKYIICIEGLFPPRD